MAEHLRRLDLPVRAIVRQTSDTRFLRSIGVDCVPGDLADRTSLESACQGVGVVYHAAARVGDWGPWHEFVRDTIEGTRSLLEVAARAQVERFVHVSSISAYGYVHGEGKVYEESSPLGSNLNRWAYYSRAKIEAEKLAWEMHRTGRLPVTVIRPSWMYGERDRATLPRLLDSIRKGKLRLIGDGENRLNLTNASNVGEAIVLAGVHPRAPGEAYNVCHDGVLTQKQFFNRIAQELGMPIISRSIPYRVAHSAAFVMECAGHAFRSSKPPLVTRYAVWLMGRRCFFECKKIKEQLGWSSTIGYDEGIPAAVRECLGIKRNPKVQLPSPTPVAPVVS